MVRRSCYETVGRFNPSLPFTADWEMWLRAALYFDVGYLVAPLVHCRRHDRQETLRFSGLKDLEQSYLAKRLVLSDESHQIRDREHLKAEVAKQYRNAGIAAWHQCRLNGEALDASAYLNFAIHVQGSIAESAADYIDWFVDIAEEVFPLQSAAVSKEAPTREVLASIRQTFEEPRSLGTRHTDREELQRARAEITALRGSLSWKFTRPLRAGFDVVLKVRKLFQTR